MHIHVERISSGQSDLRRRREAERHGSIRLNQTVGLVDELEEDAFEVGVDLVGCRLDDAAADPRRATCRFCGRRQRRGERWIVEQTVVLQAEDTEEIREVEELIVVSRGIVPTMASIAIAKSAPKPSAT